MTDSKAEVFMYEPRGRRKVLKIGIRGTTFTGHPCRTTWGNTIRMISYICYFLYKMGVDLSGDELNQKCFENSEMRTQPANYNSGDDVVMMMEQEDLDKFMSTAMTYTLDANPDPGDWTMKGLGQIFKEFKSDPNNFDFLSRDGQKVGTKVFMRR